MVHRFAVAVYVIVTGLKVTNPLHGLYYGLEPSGGAFGLVVTHETLYWVVMAVAYALASAGYLMIFELFLEAGARTGPLAILTGLTALPAALNVLGHVDTSFLDITHEPLGVAVFAVGLLVAYETQFSVVQLTGNVEAPNLTIGQDGRIRGLGGQIQELIPPLNEEALGTPLGEALPGLAATIREDRSVWKADRADGPRLDCRYFQVVSTRLERAGKTRTVILSDITGRKKREQKLRRSDRRFRAMFNDPNILAGVLASDGTVQEINDRAMEYIGAEMDAVAGQPFWETPWWDDETRPLIREKVQTAAEGEYANYEVTLERPDGTPYAVNGIIRPVVTEEGDVVSLFVTARDITERKRKARRLKEAKKHAELSKLEAEEASRMKSAMLANMSHEIRTPLTGIIGFAEAIGDEVDSDEARGGQVARFANLIENSGRRLLDTLDAVLNLSKLEAGKMTLDAEPIDLAEEARRVAGEFAAEAEESGLELKVEAQEEKVQARADEGGVKIVLQNLLSNAIKYTEEGWVKVRTRVEGDQAVLEVEDTGIGMDPETAEGLFDPFRQASEGLSREYEGTGIGLAVTKKTIKEMRGSVDIDTQKGEGSRFTVRFPATEEARAPGADT
jgi:PAS domain S-box-containing protein